MCSRTHKFVMNILIGIDFFIVRFFNYYYLIYYYVTFNIYINFYFDYNTKFDWSMKLFAVVMLRDR